MLGIKRSLTDRKLLGVLGGIAKRFKLNSTHLRLGVLLLSLVLLKEIVICYLGLALILPNEEPKNNYTSRGNKIIKDAKKVD